MGFYYTSLECFLEKIARDCCESNLITLPPPVPSHGGHHRPWWRHHFTQWWSWFDPTRCTRATPARLKTSTRYPGTQGRRVDPRLALSPIAHPSMCHTYIIAHSELASPCTHALSRMHVCSRHTVLTFRFGASVVSFSGGTQLDGGPRWTTPTSLGRKRDAVAAMATR